MARKELLVEVARRTLLQINEKNSFLKFAWWRDREDLSLISFPVSVLNLRPGSGQRQVASTETVLNGTVVDGEENKEAECQCISGNSIDVDIFYTFLDYRTVSCNDDIVKKRIMQLSCLDSWVATVFTYFEQREKRGQYRQKV